VAENPGERSGEICGFPLLRTQILHPMSRSNSRQSKKQPHSVRPHSPQGNQQVTS
jgi:hypothetical protein